MTNPALTAPASPDPAPTQQALVLNAARTTPRGTTAANTVIGILTLPAITTFVTPADCRLIPAGSYKVGDTVPA
jgi:hypothetical protein